MSQGLNAELPSVSLSVESAESVELTSPDEPDRPDRSADILIIAAAMTACTLVWISCCIFSQEIPLLLLVMTWLWEDLHWLTMNSVSLVVYWSVDWSDSEVIEPWVSLSVEKACMTWTMQFTSCLSLNRSVTHSLDQNVASFDFEQIWQSDVWVWLSSAVVQRYWAMICFQEAVISWTQRWSVSIKSWTWWARVNIDLFTEGAWQLEEEKVSLTMITDRH